jgi:ABC-type Fe3+-hydroxamate transport system substrate-binding protein
MITSTDQMNRKLTFTGIPRRVISTVPSQSELLYSLGLDDEVLAITKFCIHPGHWFRNKERIGGTKKLDVAKIISMQPDLILANAEENTKEQIETLAEKFPVWISDIKSFDDAIKMIRLVGTLLGREQRSGELVSEIESEFGKYTFDTANPQKALYLIWKDPYMAAGCDTFISDMMLKAGYQNVITGKRYPEISTEEIRMLDAEVIFLSSEPFPFTEKHVHELAAATGIKNIHCVDGELFSWYGSRMIQSPSYFAGLRKKTLN